MSALCSFCADQVLELDDHFCPNCGEVAGAFKVEFSPGAGQISAGDVVQLVLTDNRSMPAGEIDLVVTDDDSGQILEDVPIEALLDHGSVELPGVTAGRDGPLSLVVRARHRGFPPVGSVLARTAFNQGDPSFMLSGGMLSADLAGDGSEGWVPIRLTNLGGAAQIGGAVLRRDGAPANASACTL